MANPISIGSLARARNLGVVPTSDLQNAVLEELFNRGPMKAGELFLVLPYDAGDLCTALTGLRRLALVEDDGKKFSLAHRGKRHLLGLILWMMEDELSIEEVAQPREGSARSLNGGTADKSGGGSSATPPRYLTSGEIVDKVLAKGGTQ